MASSTCKVQGSVACIVLIMLCWSAVNGQLTTNFYDKTCPQALSIVKTAIQQALAKEARMGASLLRLVQLGGPTWPAMLGRRDSRTASQSAANRNLPGPGSSLSTLVSAFRAQGLSAKDMVALSGAHTIGQARCLFFRSRIYNESNIDKSFATSLQPNCPFNSGSGDNNLSPLDAVTPNVFDNVYYQSLRTNKGLFHSDQELFNGGSADAQVNSYSSNQKAFFDDFAAAMVSMGNLKPLTGRQGEIRKECSRVN